MATQHTATTSPDLPVDGFVAAGFEPMRRAFERTFREQGDLGAAVCVVRDGRVVVDLWGGWADADRTTPWAETTIVNVWSATKGIVAVCAHLLADRGLLDVEAPVGRYWPEFARAGKAQLPVRHLLTHQAGLAAVFQDLPDGAALDWELMVDALAAEPPNWEPGTEVGYHAMTFGWLVGEVIRRISGRSIGDFIREQLAEPLGVDVAVGVPVDWLPRVAEFNFRPPATGPVPTDHPAFADRDSLLARTSALSIPPLNARVNDRAWRTAQMPGANGHANARALATIYGELACGRLVGPETLAHMSRLEVDVPDDFVLRAGMRVRRSLGFQLPVSEAGDPQGPLAFGHNGAGGQRAWADPERRIGFAYTTNLFQSSWPNSDPRGDDLYRAMTACLDAVT